jgi:hypothetical protein
MLIFSVLLRLFRGAAEPVLETRGTKARVVARRETLVIDCRAGIQGFGIGDYRPWVPCCTQELPNQLVLTDRFGTSQLDRAVQRLRKGHIHQGGGDIVRCDICIIAAGSRTVRPSVADWAMPPTNSKNWVARTIV